MLLASTFVGCVRFGFDPSADGLTTDLGVIDHPRAEHLPLPKEGGTEADEAGTDDTPQDRSPLDDRQADAREDAQQIPDRGAGGDAGPRIDTQFPDVGSTPDANTTADAGTPTDGGIITSLDHKQTFVAGGTGNDRATFVAADSLGNIYVAGTFSGARVPFGSRTLAGDRGGSDVFLLSLNSNGALRWAHSHGGPSSDAVTGLAVSGGTVAAAFNFSDSANYGSTTFKSSGNVDGAVAFFDTSDGTHRASEAFGGSARDRFFRLAAFPDGEFAVTSTFQSTDAHFHGNATVYDSGDGEGDLLVVRYSPRGARDWVNHYGGTESELLTAATIDNSGNLFISGWFKGKLNVGAVSLTSAAGKFDPYQDVYLAKIVGGGDTIWARKYDANGAMTWFDGMVSDGKGGVYASGSLHGTVDLKGTAGQLTAPFTNRDIMVAHIGSSGDGVWARSYGSIGNGDFAYGVVVDRNGNVIVAGKTAYTINFGGSDLVSAKDDFFLFSLTGTGAYRWSHLFGGPGDDQAIGLAQTPNGELILVGGYEQDCDFGNTGPNPSNNGGSDLFIAQYGQSAP